MAITLQTALLLKFLSKNHKFNETATLGRQRIDMKELKNSIQKF